MDLILLISGLSQIVLSLVIGVLFIFFVFRVFNKLTRGINDVAEIRENNVAVAILNGSIILAIVMIVKNSIETSITVLTNSLRRPNSVFMDYVEVAGIMLGHIAVSGIIAFLSVYIALRFFMMLTRGIDEMLQIKNNNIAVSIIVAVVIVSMALLIQQGIGTLLDALIPFPPVSIADFG